MQFTQHRIQVLPIAKSPKGEGEGVYDVMENKTLIGAFTHNSQNKQVRPLPLQATDQAFCHEFWHWVDFLPRTIVSTVQRGLNSRQEALLHDAGLEQQLCEFVNIGHARITQHPSIQRAYNSELAKAQLFFDKNPHLQGYFDALASPQELFAFSQAARYRTPQLLKLLVMPQQLVPAISFPQNPRSIDRLASSVIECFPKTTHIMAVLAKELMSPSKQ